MSELSKTEAMRQVPGIARSLTESLRCKTPMDYEKDLSKVSGIT